MASTTFRQEEGIGLATAIVIHAALLAIIVLRPNYGDGVEPPERIAVTLSDEIGLVSTSPDPFSDAAPDVAPIFGEEPEPDPAAVRPLPTPTPQRAVTPPKPRERLSEAPPKPPRKQSGGSRLADNFLPGQPGATGTRSNAGPPAQAIDSRVRAALSSAISRQLKPRWTAPQGVDAEQLVTVLAWNLNRDGSLSGMPRIVRQYGITDANRAQAGRHAEQAVRAVQLAAPFNLPPEYYDGWKRIQFDFDKSLSR